MTYKEHRELKVYEASGRNYKSIPQIRLQGDWLKDFDFDIGTPINVECQSDSYYQGRHDMGKKKNYKCILKRNWM